MKLMSKGRLVDIPKEVPKSRGAEIAACVAHDLKTPLTTIKTCVAMLKGREGEKFDENDSYLVDLIDKEISRLDEVIHTIMFCARDCVIEPTEVHLAPIVNSVIQRMKFGQGLDGIEFELDLAGDPILLANHLQVERVFENVIQNSIDALGGKGKISIRLEADEQKNSLNVVIRDNGPGIPAEIEGKIFDRFVSGKLEGVGIGLAIVREIVSSYGGSVAFTPNLKDGAELRLTLPLAKSALELEVS